MRFLKAVTKGWIFARDNPEEAAAIVYDAAINAEAAFPVGPVHQLWQMNEVNKLIWAGGDFGLIDQARLGQDGRGRARGQSTRTASSSSPTEPAESAYSNEYIEKALAELEDEGVDGRRRVHARSTSTLTEGGK